MTEIPHTQFADQLQKPEALAQYATFLVHGEPVLVEQCAGPLIDVLLKGATRQIHCEVVDGMPENIPDALERINTYALSAGPKIIWFKDAKLFDATGSQQRVIDHIQEALESDQIDRAAKGFAQMCAKLGLTVSADLHHALPAELKALQSAVGDEAIARLIDHCQAMGGSGATADYVQVLEQAIQKGFPSQHALVITAGMKIPKNRKFYKTLQAHGLIIDCSVPTGERRADKMAQEAVLRQIMETALRKAGKRMSPALFVQLSQSTGFDPATFRDNLEKLVAYTGQRSEIGSADLENVVRRTKVDPIFELTNAVAERHLLNALFYLQALLKAEWHPLQILTALANQIRKLMIAKIFTQSPHGRSWHGGISYAHFQAEVLPALQSYDAHVSEQVNGWKAAAGQPSETKGKQAGKKDASDLALASNPANPYPIYQTLLKSENYAREELVRALAYLSEADLRLKSTGPDAAALMKTVVMAICGKTLVR
jgi:DNA polymerase-3 subunit delta